MPLRFPKSARLTRAAEFRRVREEGKPFFGRLMILNVLRAEGGEGFKVGIVTSRRVGGAVVRNRVRRRLREIVRHHREELIADVQAVIVAKKAAAEASFQDLSAEWLRLARRASILLPR